jgi:protein-S-isoprenylcysteine O-methyltransferase Ste14
LFDPGIVRLVSIAILMYSVVLVLVARERLKDLHSRGEQSEHVGVSPPLAVEVAWIITSVTAVLFVLVPPLFLDLVYGNLLTMTLPFSTGLQTLGIVFLIAGGALAWWSAESLGRFFTRRIRVVTDYELVIEGPYSRIRHPIYSSVLMLISGLTLLYLNALLPIVLVLGAWSGYRRARAE